MQKKRSGIEGQTLDALDEDDFRRERLGIWPEEIHEAAVDMAAWRALGDPSADRPSKPIAFAVDVTTAGSVTTTAIGSAARRGDGTVQVDVVDMRPGTGWVVDRLVSLAAEYGPA